MRLSCGAASDTVAYGTLLGLWSEGNGWSKCAIGHERPNTYDRGDIVFFTRDIGDLFDCVMSDIINAYISNGNVTVNNNLNCGSLHVAGNDIYNYIFNYSGRNHSTYTNFNSIDKLGYTIIQNTTNGPNTGAIFFQIPL